MAKTEIDDSLLKELRDHCDRQNIRLRDFLEDALETAIYRDEVQNAVGETRNLMKEIERERDNAYRRGFIRGFYAAFCVSHGKLGVYAESCEKIKTNAPYRWVTGPQLSLFQ